MEKKYKLLSGIKQVLLALALTVFSGSVYSQVTYTFNYTGLSQTIALGAGSYSLQCWGANGGTANGGKGGYSSGSITVTSPTTLYVCVGGAGMIQGNTGSNNAIGGWNGGGNGSCYASYGTSSGGGGGSDIRTTQNTTYANRIIVGGGGGGGSVPGSYGYVGGNGGGTTGANGTNYVSGSTSYWAGTGGTQSAGGNGTTESNSIVGAGTFGVGGTHTSSLPGSGWAGCGGGGGYYGGSAGGAVHSAGGGGSGYIGGVTGGTTAQFGQTGFVANPVTTGNGLVLIKELCSVTLMASTTNSLNPIICSGQSLTLTTNAISNYSWSTGASSSSLVVSPTTNTVYGLSATSPSNCTSSASIAVLVNPGLPVLSITNPNSNVCIGNSASLTATGAITYTWTNSGVVNGQSFIPSSSAIYTVTGENACGTSTAATSISVNPLPTITTVISQPTICSTQPVTITAVGNGTNYTWVPNIPNGGAIYPLVNSTYTATGFSAFGCTISAVASVSVVTTPATQPLSNPPLICVGSSATLTAPGATSYTWTTPSGTLGTTQIIVSPAVTTTYTVAKSNANCVNTQTVQVIVNNLPSVQAFATPSIVCAGKPAVLQGGGALTFTWTAPSYSATGASPTVNPVNSTTYVVTASDGTCINTATTAVLTNPNPVISIVPSASTICRGDVVDLSANGALNYTWTTSSGTLSAYPGGTAFVSGFQDYPDQTTLYTITGVNTYTCYTTVTQVVVVNPTPTLNIQTTKPLVCTGAVSTLTVSGANTYSWDANAGNATTSITPVSPAVTTVYTVTGFYNGTMCHSDKTIQVAVFLPTFAVNSPTSSCLGGTINLIASGANSYTWATIPPQPFSQIAVTPPTPTFYIVTATSNSNGVNCTSTRTVDIDIYANPTITAVTSKTLVCKGEPVFLMGGGGVNYVWTPSFQNGDTVSVSPVFQTTYNVLGTDQNGCTGTATVLVKISTCFGIEELNANKLGINVYPNPNNGQFTISSEKDLTLELLNSIGQHIRTFTIRAGEDQKINLGHLPAGVYFISGTYEGEKFAQKMIIN